MFFLKILFVKEKKAIANWKPTQSLTPIFVFKFREMTLLFFFLNKPPFFPFNVYHLLVLNPSKEIAPAYLSRSLLCSFYQKNEKLHRAS